MSSRRRRRRPVWLLFLAILTTLLVAWWWLQDAPESTTEEAAPPAVVSSPNATIEFHEVPLAATRGRRGSKASDETMEPSVTYEPERTAPASTTVATTSRGTEPSRSDRTGDTAVDALQQAARLVGTDPARSRHHLTRAWLAGLDGGSRASAIAQARRLAQLTMLKCSNPQDSPFLTARKVAPNESLGIIRQRDSIRMSSQFLAEVNSLTDPNRIKAGQTLYFPRGKFDAIIDLSSRDLAVFQEVGERRDLLVVLPIEIGRTGETPTGDFRVRTAEMQRRHHRISLDPRLGEAHDDPEGMGLELVARTGAGAGTGRSIRLDPKDAALLFELLGAQDGATVEIRE